MFNIEKVKERLKSFSYEVKESDEFSLTFCIDKIKNTVCNEINQKEIPEGLEHIAVDMVVGEFLFAKKTFLPDDLNSLDLDCAVKQIQEGDTNITFSDGSSTAEQRLNSFINYLLGCGKAQFSKYRRVQW